MEVRLTGGYGADQRRAFGTDRQAVSAVLDVGASEDAAVSSQQGGADPVAAVGRVRLFAGLPGNVDERFPVGHSGAIYHAFGCLTL